MTQSHDSAHQPHPLTAEFPMPTSTSLASAYQNLYLAATGADEIMFVCDIFDPALRQRSLSIAADVCWQS